MNLSDLNNLDLKDIVGAPAPVDGVECFKRFERDAHVQKK